MKQLNSLKDHVERFNSLLSCCERVFVDKKSKYVVGLHPMFIVWRGTVCNLTKLRTEAGFVGGKWLEMVDRARVKLESGYLKCLVDGVEVNVPVVEVKAVNLEWEIKEKVILRGSILSKLLDFVVEDGRVVLCADGKGFYVSNDKRTVVMADEVCKGVSDYLVFQAEAFKKVWSVMGSDRFDIPVGKTESGIILVDVLGVVLLIGLDEKVDIGELNQVFSEEEEGKEVVVEEFKDFVEQVRKLMEGSWEVLIDRNVAVGLSEKGVAVRKRLAKDPGVSFKMSGKLFTVVVGLCDKLKVGNNWLEVRKESVRVRYLKKNRCSKRI